MGALILAWSGFGLLAHFSASQRVPVRVRHLTLVGALVATGASAAIPTATLDARLDELNDLCAETWCSGSFSYVFHAVRCASPTTCVLAFAATDEHHQSYGSEVALSGFQALEQDESNGFTWEGSFEEAVSAALATWEKHPSGAAPKVLATAKVIDPLVARVAELNQLCPETWCSGSFEYHFSTLTCSGAKTCTLGFVASDDQQHTFTSTVSLGGFQALTTEPFVYEGSFEEAVSVALEAWERHPVNGAPVAVATKAKAPVLNRPVAERPTPKPTPVQKVAPPLAAAPRPAPVKTVALVAPTPVVKAANVAPAPASAPAPAAHRSSKNLQD